MSMVKSVVKSMTRPAGDAPEACVAFGPFRLYPVQRVLLEEGRPVRLGSRAFDILAALVGQAGATIPKSDLIARVWPDTIVEESNLRVHVAALRKALHDGADGRRYIASEAGHGYSFVAEVQQHATPAADGAPLGRADAVRELAACLPARRLVTLTGTGGVGKSVVAQAVMRRVAHQYLIRSVDLAGIAEPAGVSAAVAEALGLPPAGDAVAALAGQPALLVLDNCDHLLDAAAALAERLLRHAPQLRMLATCREALRARDEWVVQLPPLATPPPVATAREALAWPAVALFAERAATARGSFVLTDAEAPAVAELCRRLDGVPLAIELAAARLDLFHPHELAARLDERLQILKGGRRTAPARHRSLHASLAWSCATLAPHELAVLRRLAVFTGEFSLASAALVAAGDGIAMSDVEEAIVTLNAKALLTTTHAGGPPRCRLDDGTRLYALPLLAEEAGAVHSRLVRDCTDRVAGATPDWEVLPPEQWRRQYMPQLGDVRAALAWAFGPDGDQQAGTALLIASGPLWLEAGLLAQQRALVEPALARVTAAGTDPAAEMALCTALGTARIYLEGPGAGRGAFARAFALAGQLGDAGQLATTFSGLGLEEVLTGDYPAALALARQYAAALQPDGSHSALLIHDRVAALALHLRGDQPAAEQLARSLQNRPPFPGRRSRRSALHTDEDVAAGVVLARSRWLLGHVDDAQQLARNAVLRARAVGQDTSLAYVLAFAAFPVAWWRGDRAGALEVLEELEQASARLPHWQPLTQHYRRSVAAGGAIDEPVRVAAPHHETLATLDARYLDGKLARRADAGHAGWCAAELRRLRGERLLATGEPAARGEAERLFRSALLLARNQQALSWELRAATSLARLWHRRGATRGAWELLDFAVSKFTEGLGTTDLLGANVLLREMEAVLDDYHDSGVAEGLAR